MAKPKTPTTHSPQSALQFAILTLEAEVSKFPPNSPERLEIKEVLRIIEKIREVEVERLLAEKEE